jgi:hypothetical protein
LAQRNHLGKIQIISHASKQLRENEKNYTRFLLETAAAAWGMDNFNEYLKGSKFTLYKDLTTETTLGTTQLKTLNRLRNTMIEHDFKIQDRQKADLPDCLRKRQIEEDQENLGRSQAFNKVIHVDLIDAKPRGTNVSNQAILSITASPEPSAELRYWLTTKSIQQRQPFGTSGANPTEIRKRSCPTKARFGPAN